MINNLTIRNFKFKNIDIEVNVSLQDKTIWLTLDQIARLFDRDRSVIGKHVRNICKEIEPNNGSTRANFAHVASNGKTYNYTYYNLDVIILVGHRINSSILYDFTTWVDEIFDNNG